MSVSPAETETWSRTEFEERLRDLVRRRHHRRHPFTLRMHEGTLTPEEIRRWVLNRFHYQRHIPIKDALILAKLETPELRRLWLRRIQDHDGTAPGSGGIERWLRLGEATGLDRDRMWSGAAVLPGVRVAVDGYVNFCRLRSPLEGVATSLTELLVPDLMRARIEAFERHYRWVDAAGLRYFRTRISQGSEDAREALGLVLRWARCRADQERALAALSYKCDVLWTLLDAIDRGPAR